MGRPQMQTVAKLRGRIAAGMAHLPRGECLFLQGFARGSFIKSSQIRGTHAHIPAPRETVRTITPHCPDHPQQSPRICRAFASIPPQLLSTFTAVNEDARSADGITANGTGQTGGHVAQGKE